MKENTLFLAHLAMEYFVIVETTVVIVETKFVIVPVCMDS